MALPAKKGGLGLMLSMGDEPDEGGDPMAEKKAAVREMFTAAKAGDWDAAAHAFKEAYDLCAAASVDEGEDEGDELDFEE